MKAKQPTAKKPAVAKAKDLPAQKAAKGGGVIREGWGNHNEALVRA